MGSVHSAAGTPVPEITWVRTKIKEGRYQISEHVVRFLMAKELTLPEIETAIEIGEVIGRRIVSQQRAGALIRGKVKGKVVLVLVSKGHDGDLIILLAYLSIFPQWAELEWLKPGKGHPMENPFGNCFFCGGEIKAITVGNFDYRIEGKLYVIKDTPAGLCLQCGEKYLTAETAKKLNALIEAGQFTGTEEVRVMAYAQSL